jgi:LCP family protein required for cell wall assembly
MADRRRHARAPRRRSLGQRVLLGFLSLTTVATLAAASFVAWVYAKVGELVRFDSTEVAVEEVARGETANYLIVGSDSRENVLPEDPTFDSEDVAGKRSDTIMLARINPADTQIHMVSFPRDLWLPLANGHTDRINAAYGAGRQVLIDTIEQNFDLTINHYVEVDFTGFRRMVDAIGGVPIYLDAPYRDPRANLAEPIGPGCVTMNGETALGFARSRHLERLDEDGDWETDPTADLGRITRQQFFIRKAIERVMAMNPFTNPLTFTNLLDVAVDSVGVDAGLSNDDIRDLAGSFDGFDPDTIVNYALPTRGFRTSGGAAVLDLQEGPEVDAILNVFRGLEPGDVIARQVSVTVRNGSGAERQGANTADALSAVGFDAHVDGDADPIAATTVSYAPGSEAAARLVARHLTSRAVFAVDESLDPNEVLLVTGPDFTTVVRQPWPAEEVPGPTTTTTTTTSTTATTVPESGEEGTTTTSTTEPPTTTTTEVVGFLPEAPPGTEC